MTQLDRYIARTLLSAVGLVMATLLTLGMLFLFIAEQGDVGTGHYSLLDALAYSAMSLPQFALVSFPAGALVGGLIGISVLARSHEITVMRASGMSKLRMSGSVLLSAAVLIAIALAVGELLAPPLSQLAEEHKEFAKYSDVSFAGAGGAWIRDGDVIMNVRDRSSASEFGGLLIFELSPNARIDAIARADRAAADGPKSWLLRNYAESRFSGDTVVSQQAPLRELKTGAGADFLRLAVASPSDLALRALYRAMRFLRSNNLDYSQYEFAFWSRVARVTGILVALMFALPFGFGSMRGSSLSARTSIGVMIGITYFFMQRLVESGAVAFNLNPLLLAWVPTALLALAASVMLWRTR